MSSLSAKVKSAWTRTKEKCTKTRTRELRGDCSPKETINLDGSYPPAGFAAQSVFPEQVNSTQGIPQCAESPLFSKATAGGKVDKSVSDTGEQAIVSDTQFPYDGSSRNPQQPEEQHGANGPATGKVDEQNASQREQLGGQELLEKVQNAPQGNTKEFAEAEDGERANLCEIQAAERDTPEPDISSHVSRVAKGSDSGFDQKGEAPEEVLERPSTVDDRQVLGGSHTECPLGPLELRRDGFNFSGSAPSDSAMLAIGERPELWEAPDLQIQGHVEKHYAGSAAGSSAAGGSPSVQDTNGGPEALPLAEPPFDAEVKDPEPAPLVTHRHPHPPPLSPPIQQLFERQDALRAQLLMQDIEPSQHPLITRLEGIRSLLLESGSGLGSEELESLQGEVQAMELFLQFEQEERTEVLDRRMSSSLQEVFDEEFAADLAQQLEQETGWAPAVDQDVVVECCICLEELPKKDCIAACVDAEGGVTTAGDQPREEAEGFLPAIPALPSGTCAHWHCIDCLKQYATVKIMDDRTARIPCTRATTEGCPGHFPVENVEWLLGDKETELYLTLLAEESIKTKVYCPFDGCTAVMDCAEGERGPDSICAACKRVFCRSCRVPWHKDLTCAQYQSGKDDGPLHQLAKKNKWKACPKCQNIIERKSGCNYMKCKCGCGFCYKCGTAYLLEQATSNNGHGTPGCNCGLFTHV